jgi:hypothetical protein
MPQSPYHQKTQQQQQQQQQQKERTMTINGRFHNFKEMSRIWRNIRNQSGFNTLSTLQVTMCKGLLSIGFGTEEIARKLRAGHETRWV